MFRAFFSTNLTPGVRTKDSHSIVRSRRPVVVPIECPQPKTMAPNGPQTESPRTASGAQRNCLWESGIKKKAEENAPKRRKERMNESKIKGRKEQQQVSVERRHNFIRA